jgi:antirestriction protein ArdC
MNSVKIILDEMKADRQPWQGPWAPGRGFCTNAFSKLPYSGSNILLLNISSKKNNFTSNYWATYKQWTWLNCKIKERPDNIPEGGWGTKIFSKPTLFSFVFNADQVYGPDAAQWKPNLNGVVGPDDINYDFLENVIARTGAKIRFSNYKEPQYKPMPQDFIGMPWRKRFKSNRQLYGTILHELVHWAELRLGWIGHDEDKRELAAEMGQAFMESVFKIPHCDDCTHYQRWRDIWVQKIENDPRFLTDSLFQAERVMKYIAGV